MTGKASLHEARSIDEAVVRRCAWVHELPISAGHRQTVVVVVPRTISVMHPEHYSFAYTKEELVVHVPPNVDVVYGSYLGPLLPYLRADWWDRPVLTSKELGYLHFGRLRRLAVK
jgi:hypothetical protein